MPIETDHQHKRPSHRTQYDEAKARSDALVERVRQAGGAYGAPEELIDRSLEAARLLWTARGRIRRRR